MRAVAARLGLPVGSTHAVLAEFAFIAHLMIAQRGGGRRPTRYTLAESYDRHQRRMLFANEPTLNPEPQSLLGLDGKAPNDCTARSGTQTGAEATTGVHRLADSAQAVRRAPTSTAGRPGRQMSFPIVSGAGEIWLSTVSSAPFAGDHRQTAGGQRD